MKKFKLIIFSLFISIIFITNIKAEENLVNLYLFYSNTCPHCEAEMELLDELQEDYDNLKIYKYEISENENSLLLSKVSEMFDINVTGVPFTIIGEKTFFGYSEENSKKKFIGAIEYYSSHGYTDKVGEYLGNELPTYDINNNDITVDEYIKEYGEYTFNIPFIGNVSTKDLTLPLIAIIMGFIDGINPCAMWVLLFLISMLIGMHDRKKMWILGSAFLITSAFIYFLIMLAWLNIAVVVTKIDIIRLIIAIVALLGGFYNLYSLFKTKENGCNVTTKKDRQKILERIKKFTSEKNLILSVIGVIALAISVNLIELACSAGLPVMFTQILAINNLTGIQYISYILLYILFFLIDDLIIFIIAVTSMKVSGMSVKYGKISKLIGAILLILIGILLIFKPEWLMLNF